jgi:hypothetical protein
MKDLTLDEDVREFNRSLGHQIAKIAMYYGVTINPDLSAGAILTNLINDLAKKSKNRVAILIDNYDTPFIAFMDKPELHDICEDMCFFYARLKYMGEEISFFITGLTKVASFVFKYCLYSCFKSYDDISTALQFGDICGFTQEELENSFQRHIKLTADNLKLTEAELLEKMADYYNGFCFDGVKRIYNPFSIL